MRRRILTAMLSITVLAVIGFGVPLGFVVERFVEEDATTTVERAAVLATREVTGTFASDNDPIELPASVDGIVYALYDSNGALFAGEGPDPADDITLRALTNAVVDGEVNGHVVVAVPVSADERVVGVVRATRSTNISDSRTTRIFLLLGAIGIGVIAISGALGWMLAGRLSRPVGRLRDAAQRLGDGDFGIEVPSSTIPELDQAAAAMNLTASRLRDLMARERAFSSDASHQLRTPIAGMRAAVETELAFPREDPTEVFAELLSDLDRLESTVTELLAIARAGNANTSVDLTAVITDLEATWQSRLRQHGRSVSIGPTRYQPAAIASETMLRHALDVLVDNALRHGEGVVSIAVSATEDAVIISVSDEGPGFSLDGDQPNESQLDSPAAERGLGLPLTQRLVDAMGGRMVISHPTAGSQVQIILRRADASGA